MVHMQRKMPGKRTCCAVLAGVIIIWLATALLKPRYDAFIAEDEKGTCYEAMSWITIWYHCAIHEVQDLGASEKDIDYEELVRQICKERFAFTLQEDLTSDDFCRAGGHVTITVDETTHRLSFTCDTPGHVQYEDDVTDEFLDGLDGVDSGVNWTGKKYTK